MASKIKASAARISIRQQLASASRFSPEKVDDLRRDLNAQTLEDHIRAIVDTAPPLTVEQRERLAGLLLEGVRTDAA
ncbi:hypothetical protein [Actinocorallia aurantiaca]|uniref:Uncharacterized protein n=1 Tax=Actinocorallia aurantiaca TaxID=46204 RepID=A0ABN3U802_9ACTN